MSDIIEFDDNSINYNSKSFFYFTNNRNIRLYSDLFYFIVDSKILFTKGNRIYEIYN